ncbi:Uncharacterised protein [Enterobacter asburiae]|uniref:Uncharacterized protein n=1 Tax=Enterobacter asburiae TaxID=61645 RepID=A0A376F828_ENTAS|nr:Uncharacterised protein [Enterobacter asburiae]
MKAFSASVRFVHRLGYQFAELAAHHAQRVKLADGVIARTGEDHDGNKPPQLVFPEVSQHFAQG